MIEMIQHFISLTIYLLYYDLKIILE